MNILARLRETDGVVVGGTSQPYFANGGRCVRFCVIG